MRRARVVSSKYERKGKKRCRSILESELMQLRSPITTSNVPSYSYEYSSPTLVGAPSAEARVMTRSRRARELTVLTDFLEGKEDRSDQNQIKTDPDHQEPMAAVVVANKEPEKEDDQEVYATAESESATEIGQKEMGFDDEDEDEPVMNWNAWSFEQEERAWWGGWYWDWIWSPSLHINEEVVWEVHIWNWGTDDARDHPTVL